MWKRNLEQLRRGIAGRDSETQPGSGVQPFIHETPRAQCLACSRKKSANRILTAVLYISIAVTQSFLAHGQIVISEFMADNKRAFADQDGVFSDWVELYNNST